MISFGELRKKSVEWHTELSTVEKIYALDWLLKGIFDRPTLSDTLLLRGASALANAYIPPNSSGGWDYPRAQEIDLGRFASVNDGELEKELESAANEAAGASGLQFRLHHFQPSEARFEFTGPMGRRSAAQPLIVVRLVSAKPRSELSSVPLIHPFTAPFQAQVRALSLEELAAERVVLYAQKPRARDVFDLWFILSQVTPGTNDERVKALAGQIAQEKSVALRPELDPQYAPLLERAWENALKDVRARPPFAQAQAELETRLATIL